MTSSPAKRRTMIENASVQFIALIVGSAFVGYLFVVLLRASGPPVVICGKCRYHNRPRNSRCWWCGERLR
jgi:hypothetical protein